MAQGEAIEHGYAKFGIVLIVWAVSGCASLDPLPDRNAIRELDDTPFFPQIVHQCGPAALATVLAKAGLDTSAEALAPYVYLPQRQGSLQVELLATTRRFGYVPYPVTGGLGEVIAEIDAGRPVLVLQNLGVAWYPRWHYAVVVGYDGPRDEIVLRSGITRRHVVERSRFLRTWRRASQWAFVALPPGVLPAQADAARYFEANAALEATGQVDVAEAGYLAMLARWPTSANARFGLGNLRFAQGALVAARTWFEQAIDVSGGGHSGAANNLAMAWLAAGCAARAVGVVDRALAVASAADPLYDNLQQTRDEASAALNLAEDVCNADQLQDE